MSAYTDAYAKLNTAQKQAVDTTDGPLLVIAGPGTGKTQLLSARVANILQKTDTPAQNVLCLTFTESGAANMRERLTRFIGQGAYDVTISTYHAFGSDLIMRYPEYFWETRLQSPIDDLSKRQVLLEIVEAMSFKNPLRQTRHHIGDLMSTLSEVKRALLSSDDLRALGAQNLAFITAANTRLRTIFADFNKMPSKLDKAVPYFEQTLVQLTPLISTQSIAKQFEPLAALCLSELKTAFEEATEIGKTKPLTSWKNTWLAKDADNHFIIAGELENRRINALADALDSYQVALEAKGLYDFDDMILRSIRALETHTDLRYSLQERYLYILLDEFQDTNAAQLKLIKLLTNNPVNEGRPNVLAVGDDDQAIYAFQGAQYSNMVEFYEMFKDTTVVNLSENYRSDAGVLEVASNVAIQIKERLEDSFEGMTKILTAANHSIKNSHIERREFQSDIAERAWVAGEIKRLIDTGTEPSEIAILAPKHKLIESFVPYLNDLNIPVRYEKRENILDSLVVRQLITMSQLVLAVAANEQGRANALWPQVLSYDFWQIPTATIWQISWQVSDTRQPGGGHAAGPQSWSQALLNSTDSKLHNAAEVILTAAAKVATENLETMLDYLMGSVALQTHSGCQDDEVVSSPLRAYYTSADMQHYSPELFYETLSHLTVLRAKLREFQDRADSALTLGDFIRFISMYEVAEQPMLNTSPYAQSANAVQLMTVFKAKGLEYQHVFLPGCLDDVWGSSSRGNSNKLTLPANLHPIRHAGATDDERLRILFVAITRAKIGLYMTSPTRKFSGKATTRLKYFNETQQDDGSFRTMILPEAQQLVATDDSEPPAAALLALDWRTRHIGGLQSVDLSSLLSGRLERYQISPTDVISYIDIEYAGPQRFFFDKILRFPSAPTPDSQFGTAVHETLEWCQHQTSEHGFAPTTASVIEHFEKQIRAKKLTEPRTKLEIERGREALSLFMEQRGSIFAPDAVAEKSFRGEGVFSGEAHMAGRIDRMEIDTRNKTITVIDYKTGKSYSSWKNDSKLHKYQLQLYLYKLLIEGSKAYRDYTVTSGRLEFVEPDDDGKVRYLSLEFNTKELERVRALLAVIWQRVHAFDFPTTDQYPASVAGIRQFEDDLLSGN